MARQVKCAICKLEGTNESFIPVPKSTTIASFFNSLEKSASNTLSIPKKKPSVFCIIFKLFLIYL